VGTYIFAYPISLKTGVVRALADFINERPLQSDAVSDVMLFSPRLGGNFPWYFFYWLR
jgi:hypothetical protein